MLTRWAIVLQGFDFTVEHKPAKLHVPDTLSRLLGNVTEDAAVKPSVSDMLQSQPKSASIYRIVPDDELPYYSPSPHAYKVH